MAYNPYGGGHHYGQPPNYNPYPGANPIGYPGSVPPPGMSPAPGMAPPPGVHQPHSATQANRPSGLPPSFQPPPNLPNINFNAPIIRLGGAVGPPGGSPNGHSNGMGMGVPGAPTGPGASSLPARPNMPPGGGARREPETPLSAHSISSNSGPPMRPDFRQDRFGGGDRGGGHSERFERFDRFDHRGGDRSGGGDRFDRFGDRGDRNDRGGDRFDRGDRGDRSAGGLDAARAAVRDNMHAHVPLTNDDKLRTIFVHKVPDGVGGEAALERLLSVVGRLRRWDSAKSHLSDHKDEIFGFAQYEDVDSLASAIELLKDVQVPLKKQEPKAVKDDKKYDNGDDEEMKDADAGDSTEDKDKADGDGDEEYKGFKKVALQVAVDPVSLKYIEAHQEKQTDEAKAEAKARREVCRTALKAAIHKLFYPPPVQLSKDTNGDAALKDAAADAAGIEVVNIPIAQQQEDELADVPEEMRAMVASEIASFRDRSTQRDLERLKREQEMEELERRRNGDEPLHGGNHLSGRAHSGINNTPIGPRGANGDRHGDRNGDRRYVREGSTDTEASDEELFRRELRKQQAEDDKQYQEAERKWANRERQRAAALEREKDRDRAEAENAKRRHKESLERDRPDDEREDSRKNSLYYRDHAAWLRKRAHDRADEEARDAADRRAEQEELRKQAAEMEAVRGMADSFLDQQAAEMGQKEEAKEKKDRQRADDQKERERKESAPQKVTISFGAAAQRNQAQRGASRRTVAEVEGLLDDEEQDGATKRQLVPITFEPMSAAARMSDEELNQAVRALAKEIPTERAGLWAWPVAWSFMDDAIVRDKLRPFVEKKVVEYLGVQEQFLVEVVEEHLRKHGTPEALVEELQEALDEAAEDLVKKLWRMVIFFTESEKRGLPA